MGRRQRTGYFALGLPPDKGTRRISPLRSMGFGNHGISWGEENLIDLFRRRPFLKLSPARKNGWRPLKNQPENVRALLFRADGASPGKLS
jgi:hypothetical protein